MSCKPLVAQASATALRVPGQPGSLCAWQRFSECEEFKVERSFALLKSILEFLDAAIFNCVDYELFLLILALRILLIVQRPLVISVY